MPDTLTFEEFELLSAIAAGGAACNDDSLLSGLEGKGFVDGAGVTKAGFEALEPYRVQRAVVLAAGSEVVWSPSPTILQSPWCA